MCAITRLLLACALLPVADAGQVFAAAPKPMPRATIQWENVHLGLALDRLGESVNVPVFLDRRVDPSQRISLEARDEPVDDILSGLTTERGLGVTWLDSLAYVGPERVTRQLRTLAELRREEVQQLPPEFRASLEKTAAFDWPRMTEPRDLVVRIVGEAGFQLAHPERIPYDLWPAGSLPEMSLADRLTVLLAGFDLTFRPLAETRSIGIVPVVEPVRLARQYRGAARSFPAPDRLRQILPEVDFKVDGDAVQMTGRIEDHEQLAELLAPASHPRQSPAPESRTVQRYSLRVEQQPVGKVLRELSERLGLTIELDRPSIDDAGLTLDRRISFQVEDADLDQLLAALLEPADLEFKRQGKRVQVFAERYAAGKKE